MHDPDLKQLVSALDRVVDWAASNDHGGAEALHSHLEVAALRLRCLNQRLGIQAAESPYLAFVRRLCAEREVPVVAAARA